MPDYIFDSIRDIQPEFLKSRSIRFVLLDVDNTLAEHHSQTAAAGVVEWIAKARAAGISLILVSNSSHSRVKPFAKMLDVPFVAMGMKPFTIGINRAIKELGANKKKTAIIGDQIYTDIVGGNLCGITTLLVMPIVKEQGWFFSVKRYFEEIHIHKKRREGACMKDES